MRPGRGSVWLVDLGEWVGREQAGVRPAVVISTDALNEGPSGVLIVVPVTSSRRGLPLHIELDPQESGLDEVSYAKCEDVRSVSDRRLIRQLGSIGPEPMSKIGGVLRHLLEL